jgi:hypothetical protein
MFSSLTIIDLWVDPDEILKSTEGAQMEAITVTTQLTKSHIEWSEGCKNKF